MYRRLCKTLDNKGELIPATDDVYSHIKNKNVDHYLSVYSYNESQKKTFYSKVEKLVDGKIIETINGAAGISDVFTNQFILDFDIDKLAGTSLEDIKVDTIEAIRRLKESGISEEAIQLTFSGNKGFGITVDINQDLTPDAHKKMAKNLMGDLSSFDTRVYNASRILRVSYTKHQSSGLFKMPMGISELEESIETIQEWAKDVDASDTMTYSRITLPISIMKLAEIKPERKKVEGLTLEAGVCTLDFNKKPKFLSDWKFAISEGYFPPGARNYALLILAATYAGCGFNKEATYRLLKAAAELQSVKFGVDRFSDDEIWKNMVSVVYDPSWQGGTFAEDNFPDELSDYLESIGVNRAASEDTEDRMIEKLGDGFDSFAAYAKTIEEHTIKTGIPELDERLKMRAGQLIFLLAPPSVGKTSALITVLNNTSKDGITSYFSSMDMYVHEIYKKLIQRHTKLTEDEVFDVFIREDEEKMEEFRNILKEEYGNVNLCYKSGESVGEMRRSIERIENQTGKRIDLVAVDYLELVLTEAGDPTAATAEAAQKLRELANEGRVVICLLQPNKNNSHPTEPITSFNAAKGSSSISQACTAFLTCNRPGMDSTNDNIDDHFFSMNCVKNRNGNLFAINMGWDGPTQTFYSLDDQQKERLKNLRQRQQEKKAVDAGSL